MELPSTEMGKTVTKVGLGCVEVQVVRFGHTEFEVLLDSQVQVL